MTENFSDIFVPCAIDSSYLCAGSCPVRESRLKLMQKMAKRQNTTVKLLSEQIKIGAQSIEGRFATGLTYFQRRRSLNGKACDREKINFS